MTATVNHAPPAAIKPVDWKPMKAADEPDRSTLDPDAIRAKFDVARRELNEALLERTEEIDLLYTALIASENLLLVGPPGTAKTAMLMSLGLLFPDSSTFSWLMTKFTTPEELFGMYDVSKLKAGEYVRKTTRKMPEAIFAFLDEIFKSNSAVLNNLLRIINERCFDRGDGEVKVPLTSCVAGSNEYPDEENGGKDLAALFDRFVIRKEVSYVKSTASKLKLLFAPDSDFIPKFSVSLNVAELAVARKQASLIPPSEAFTAAIMKCLDRLRSEGITPGDRRIRKASRVTQAAAWLAGSPTVEPEHGDVLSHVLWDDPATQIRKVAEVVGECMNPTGHSVSKLLVEADEVIKGHDHGNTASTLQTMRKLNDILSNLKKLGSTPRVQAALKSVQHETTQIKIRALEI